MASVEKKNEVSTQFIKTLKEERNKAEHKIETANEIVSQKGFEIEENKLKFKVETNYGKCLLRMEENFSNYSRVIHNFFLI